MKIRYLLISILAFSLAIHGFIEELFSLSQSLHQKFQILITHSSYKYKWLTMALIAGEDHGIRKHSEIKTFLILGLYHLIVVSGSHVSLIQAWAHRFFRFLPLLFQEIITASTLVLFTMLNQFDPPCTRAMVQFFLSKTKLKDVLTSIDVWLLTNVSCLIIWPTWYKSASFQMSAAASLVLILISQKQKMLRTLMISLVLATFLFSFQRCLSWLIIPMNILGDVILEFVLLPCQILGVVSTTASGVCTPIMDRFFIGLEWVTRFKEPQLCFRERVFTPYGLVFILLAALIVRLMKVSFQRKKIKILWEYIATKT